MGRYVENIMTLLIDSPCMGICSTVYGDTICRGCKRHYREVIDWNRLSAIQKHAINLFLQQQIEKVTTQFVHVENAAQLKSQLDRAAIRPPLYDSPLCWAYELLRLRAQQMTTLIDYGLRAKPPYDTFTANALFTVLDDMLYAEAQR